MSVPNENRSKKILKIIMMNKKQRIYQIKLVPNLVKSRLTSARALNTKHEPQKNDWNFC